MSGATAMPEVWRGGVNAWECDENGHLNTRFYVQRAAEGVMALFALSGLPGLFRPGAASTAVIREMHIRFHREALLSAPLRMTGGFEGVSHAAAEVVLILDDPETAEVKATFRARLEHLGTAGSNQPRLWPAGFSPGLVPVPPEALPRATGTGPAVSVASAEAAQRMGLQRIAMGVVGPDRVDSFGCLVAQGFVGAVSDGIRTLSAPLREIVARHASPKPRRIGGAVVEFRVLHMKWPREGDLYEVRSGLAGVEGHVKSLVHWMLDPISGRVYGSMQSIAVDFDLDRRALIRLTPDARAELQTLCVPGLAL
jgi:acyl-CoA thioester hydrolase